MLRVDWHFRTDDRNGEPPGPGWEYFEFPAPPEMPFVTSNFIVDRTGLAVLEGEPHIVDFIAGRASYPDGTPRRPDIGATVDARLMRNIRALADAVMWGRKTMALQKDQNIIPDLLGDHDLHAFRKKLGRPSYPTLIVVTTSCDIDPLLDQRAFHTYGLSVILLTNDARTPGAGRKLRAAAITSAKVLGIGREKLDLRLALKALRQREGIKVIVCEGGHGLITSLHDGDLLDEAFVTVSNVTVPLARNDLRLKPKYLFDFDKERAKLIAFGTAGDFKFYRWRWTR